jgi:hypothetical protein
MTNVMSLLNCVDNKLFRNNLKQDSYSKQRSNVKMQFWIALEIFRTVVFSIYSYTESTWTL